MTYTVAEAQKKLSQLIKEAEDGARVIITRRGVPVAEIVVTVSDAPRKRSFGVLGNKRVVLDPDWARPQEDVDGWR